VPGLAVELIAPTGVYAGERVTRTDELGRYEFRALPPASFQIGLGPPPRPGEPDGARVPFAGADGSPLTIALARGARVADVDLFLPARVETVTLTGIALTPDGDPQPGARVHVIFDVPRMPLPRAPAVIAGADGRFALSVIAGHRYRVIAQGYRDGRLVSHADPVIVDAAPAAAPVTLRLQPLRPAGRLRPPTGSRRRRGSLLCWRKRRQHDRVPLSDRDTGQPWTRSSILPRRSESPNVRPAT
jgi:hypothetical protein